MQNVLPLLQSCSFRKGDMPGTCQHPYLPLLLLLGDGPGGIGSRGLKGSWRKVSWSISVRSPRRVWLQGFAPGAAQRLQQERPLRRPFFSLSLPKGAPSAKGECLVLYPPQDVLVCCRGPTAQRIPASSPPATLLSWSVQQPPLPEAAPTPSSFSSPSLSCCHLLIYGLCLHRRN